MSLDLAAQGQETLEILRRGHYVGAGGRRVRIAAELESSYARTREWAADEEIGFEDPGRRDVPRPTVEPVSTLAASLALFEQGLRPVALNFASATHPGGGFLGGAPAQEESLARASGLYHAIENCAFYDRHRHRPDPLHSDAVIYSPDVPVIRDDEGRLLDEPWPLSIITCAAPNNMARTLSAPALEAAFAGRTRRVLAAGAFGGHDAIVLGAWGCGVFQNDPAMVADAFADALRGPAGRSFGTVVFAILDHGRRSRCLTAFEQRFGR